MRCVILQDKLQQFWDMSKTQVEDLQAENRQKDREVEEQTERYEAELKVRGVNLKAAVGLLTVEVCVH